MNIVITGRKIEITPSLKRYTEQKIGKFKKYAINIEEAVVTMSIQKYMHKIEVQLHVGGTIIKAMSVTEELYSAIDEVVEKLDIQVKKYKEKFKDKRLAAARALPKGGKAKVADEAAAEASSIIERKQFHVKPMPPEEAAMQLSLAEQSFFVFTNSETGKLNVIYKRGDGNFGLIEPVSK